MTDFLQLKNRITQHLTAHHLISKQFLSFLIIGSFSTLISYSSFFVALRFFGLHYLIANICGFVFSIGFNYYCNKRWTFDVSGSKHFYHYFGFYLFSLVLSSLILKFFVELCGIIPEIANIITIALVTCINFCGIKFLVFKK